MDKRMSVFEGWGEADIEEYVDAVQDDDFDTQFRITALYGMTPGDIVKVYLMSFPKQPTWRQRLMNRLRQIGRMNNG